MKRKIIALMFAIVLCLTSAVVPCLAAVADALGETEHVHVHSDCGIEGCTITGDHDHAGEAEAVDKKTILVVGDVEFSSDKKTATVTFNFIDSSSLASDVKVQIFYDSNRLVYKSIDGELFGKTGTAIATGFTSNSVTMNHTSDKTDIPLGGRVTITFEIKSTDAHSYIYVSGEASGYMTGGEGGKPTTYTMSAEADAWYCDHSFTYTEEVPATCKKTGVRYTKCRSCGAIIKTEELPIDETKHDYPATPTLEAPKATCTTMGRAQYVCKNCGKIKIEDVPALGHEFVKESAVHDDDGKWWEKCKRCGRSVISEIQCAHEKEDYVLLTVTRPATCTTDGYGSYKCSKCGNTATLTIKGGHKYEFERRVKEPTKTEEGIDLYKCSVCGKEETRVVAKLANHEHKWDAGTITKAPTCKDTGIMTYKCTVAGCTETKEASLAADSTKHSYGEWKVTDATCTKAGSRTRTCSLCGKVDTQIIEAKGHSFGAWTTITKATCANDGEDRHTCSVCNFTETRTISKSTVAHVYPESEYKVVKAPTCSEAGVETCICSVCQKATDSKELPINPEAHSFGAWTVTKEATCITEGESKRACALCGKVESKTITAQGHDFVVVESKKGTTVKECNHCHMTHTVTETKNGSIVSVKSNGYTLTFPANTATDKDIFFNVRLMTSEEFNEKVKPFVDQITANPTLAQQYGTVENAYIYTLVIDGVDATLTTGTELVIDLGDEYKKTAFNVCYMDESGALKTVSADYINRKGTTMTITIGSGTFKYPANSIVLFNTGVKKANYAVPIVIVVLAFIIAGGAVAYIVMKNKKNDEHMQDTNI